MGEHFLDAVHFRRNVGWRDAGDFGDGGAVETLQVEQHELPIGRFELLHQPSEPLQVESMIGRLLALTDARKLGDVLQTDEAIEARSPIAQDV